MRELSVAEQRYQAVLPVIEDCRTVTETAPAAVGVAASRPSGTSAHRDEVGLEPL